MELAHLFSLLCVISISHGKSQLSLESDRGSLRLKNFLHLHKHRLEVEPLAKMEVNKEMKCTASCTKSKECFSFNVKKITENKFLCELLNTSKYQNAENLTKDESFVHWYLQDLCVPNPCKYGYCDSGKKTELRCDCRAYMGGKRCERCQARSKNFALGKPTAQSSTYSDGYGTYGPQLAVDGNKATFCISSQGQPQCAHTYDGDRNWWRVDFGEEVPVARVAITNRGDCCWDRLGDFELKVGDSLVNNGLENPKCGDRHSIGAGTTNITCTPIIFGRHLVIHSRLVGAWALNICEVEVYCQ